VKAIQIKAFGDVGGLDVVELPDPVAAPDLAVVRVEAAAVNPSDVKNVQGAMRQTTLPRVPGRDYAGVVERGPAEWVGAKVWGTGGDVGFTRDGTHAQKVTVPVASLRRMPSRLSFDEAASVGVCYVTAWCGVVVAASLQPGETLAVIGAGGGVGGSALASSASPSANRMPRPAFEPSPTSSSSARRTRRRRSERRPAAVVQTWCSTRWAAFSSPWRWRCWPAAAASSKSARPGGAR